jgi:DUF1365 family protein
MLSSSWADVVVPTLLVVTWLLISPLPSQMLSWLRPISRKSKDSQVYSASTSKEDDSPASGYILPVLIHHARMLPKESQHSFRYPSLFLALKLADLESGKTQLNRVFSYIPVNDQWCLSKLDPDGFGRRTFPGIDNDSEMHKEVSRSILFKLLYELRVRKYTSVGPQDVDAIKEEDNPWDKEVGHIWAVAMPTLLGMGGFNPLTVYYVYRPSKELERGKLWLVVLEVHNTFIERHVYICQVGIDENQEQRKGYQHSWTFAREFHVSPFNDRLGYYQLLMNDLWDQEGEADTVPTLDVRLLLLSPAEEDDEVQDQELQKEINYDGETKTKKLNKKLLATLMSSKAKSNSLKPSKSGLRMTRMNMLSALAAQPFDLVLPGSRIMIEAAKLHWRKGLPVFIRPEQRGEGLSEQQSASEGEEKVSSLYDGLEWPVDLNPTQNNSKKEDSTYSSSGSIYWNQDTFLEKACQSQFERLILQQSIEHKDICLSMISRNAEVSPNCFYNGKKYASPSEADLGESTKQLSLYTLSSSFYLDFALYIPSQARLFGSLMDRNWGVSSIGDFEVFFSTDEDVFKKSRGWKNAVATRARRWHMQWALRQSPSYANDKSGIAHKLITDAVSNHPYNSMNTPFSFLLALLLHIFIIRLTAGISALLHINYVRPPWAQVAEGYQKLLKEAP